MALYGATVHAAMFIAVVVIWIRLVMLRACLLSGIADTFTWSGEGVPPSADPRAIETAAVVVPVAIHG